MNYQLSNNFQMYVHMCLDHTKCISSQVKVTNENGFHQCDLGASLAGFLESHPLQVFASIHHIDNLFPLYPGMANRTLGLQKMAQFMRPDPVGFVQQAICYDQLRAS